MIGLDLYKWKTGWQKRIKVEIEHKLGEVLILKKCARDRDFEGLPQKLKPLKIFMGFDL